MSIEIKMPALSPTMEEGTLARWLVKAGDTVKAGDVMAEIETDKATMELEAVDEGVVAEILVAEGTDGVAVGTMIARLAGEGEAVTSADEATPSAQVAPADILVAKERGDVSPALERPAAPAPLAAPVSPADAARATPLARRLASQGGIDLGTIRGSGPNGQIVKADLKRFDAAAPEAAPASAPAPAFRPAAIPDIPHETAKLSNMRKTIARRLTESKQQVPHIYLTVDIQLDALLKLRGELNASLTARGVKLSVNDMLVKALGIALIQVPKCNVMFTLDQLVSFSRADISVAVSTPAGLITPIIPDAANASLSSISLKMKDLAARARENKLKPEEFQGGTASISNMGMYGIKQFEAVINPPQGMILAVGTGEQRPYVIDGALGIATVMTVTGSFDHRAIDGADGAALMQALRELIEQPMLLAA